MAMDHYAMERWILDRHEEAVRRAELRSRLVLSAGAPPAGQWAAQRLRRLADLLDGGVGVPAESGAAGLSATSSS